jgi:hypothetical protein
VFNQGLTYGAFAKLAHKDSTARAMGKPNSSKVVATAVVGVLCVASVTMAGRARSNNGSANSRPTGTNGDSWASIFDRAGGTVEGSDAGSETGTAAAAADDDTVEVEEEEEDEEEDTGVGSVFMSNGSKPSPRSGDNDATVRGRRNTGSGNDDDVDESGKAVRGGDGRGPAAVILT